MGTAPTVLSYNRLSAEVRYGTAMRPRSPPGNGGKRHNRLSAEVRYGTMIQFKNEFGFFQVIIAFRLKSAMGHLYRQLRKRGGYCSHNRLSAEVRYGTTDEISGTKSTEYGHNRLSAEVRYGTIKWRLNPTLRRGMVIIAFRLKSAMGPTF